MTTTVKLTLDGFLALPETKPASEYADGEVIQKPMPQGAHAFIQAFLVSVLLQYLAQMRLGRVGTEWRCVFGLPGNERTVVPDIVYVARDRFPANPADLLGIYRGAPTLVVEIMSPDQRAAYFADKVQFYLLHGVLLVWVVDPASRTVRVFAPGQDTRLLTDGDTLDGGELLPGFSVHLQELFAQLEP
jgi:Uma2 family endonuclease